MQSTITNFVGGKNYRLNPLQCMQIVCTSMICGESQYYRPAPQKNPIFLKHFLFQDLYMQPYKNVEYPYINEFDYFTNIISDALDYDFAGTLEFVSLLRNGYFMRLNSHVLITQALHHPKRAEFNSKHPNVFRKAIENACNIPTDWTTQFRLLKESGKPIPTIWKKTIATQLENMTSYHANKYIHGSKTQGKTDTMLANIVDLIRLTHPRPNRILNELIKTGKIDISDEECTWEKLRSSGKNWDEITQQIQMPHMALLRNLSNILNEYSTYEKVYATIKIRDLVSYLVRGVEDGKQFPFRYYSAYKKLTEYGTHENDRNKRKYTKYLEDEEVRGNNKIRFSSEFVNRTYEQELLYQDLRTIVLDGLNECILKSLYTIPALPGRVDCLTDNSGSARGAVSSEYGSVGVYEISNLSAILTAYRSTQGGSVWVFGDTIAEYKVSTEKPILKQLDEVNAIGRTVGPGTETGVWLFWQNAILKNRHLDHVFIYSDMQAGTGQLFADKCQEHHMKILDAHIDNSPINFIDVLSLISTYRERIHSKTNVFSVQVAGYNNNIMPDIMYRGALLSGWTGKEAKLAYEMSELWNKIEKHSGCEET